MSGREDMGIKRILSRGDKDSESSRLRSILLKVIKNELTPRQKEIIMLYYFKGADIADISERLGIFFAKLRRFGYAESSYARA